MPPNRSLAMRTKDITSITQHRDHLRDHLNQVNATGRPMFITNKSGDTEAVVMSPKTYDNLMEQTELLRSLEMLDKSMAQVKAGKGKDLQKALRDIAKEIGARPSR